MRILKGVVVSDKMNKTRVVEVEWIKKVPKYEKRIKRKTKYYCHDENNISKTGDVVEFVYARPLSKLKRFRILKVIK